MIVEWRRPVEPVNRPSQVGTPAGDNAGGELGNCVRAGAWI